MKNILNRDLKAVLIFFLIGGLQVVLNKFVEKK